MTKKTHLIAVIMLMSGILLGLGGSYYYFEIIRMDKNNITKPDMENDSPKETIEVKNLDIFDDLVQDNFNKFMYADTYNCGAQEEYFKANKVTVDDIANHFAYVTVSRYFANRQEDISADEFENIVKMYFGKDYSYQHQELNKVCNNHHYNATTNTYKYVEPQCGGTCGPHKINYKISKAELSGDKLILNVKVLFPGNYETDKDNDGFVRYYSDANLTKVVSGLTYEWGQSDKSMLSIYDNDKNLSKGGNYKFIMQKYDENHYSFVSSEPLD